MKLNKLSCSKVILVTLALSLLPPTIYARSKKLVEPDPVTLNCDLSEKQMQLAIRNGGAVRNWIAVGQTPGLTELNYKKGGNKHSINVNVSYTKNTFAVTYKSSINLNYHVNKKGIREIHPKPNKWMSNLSGDIERFTNSECFEDSAEPDEPVQAQSKSELIQQCIDACTKATSKTSDECFVSCTD